MKRIIAFISVMILIVASCDSLATARAETFDAKISEQLAELVEDLGNGERLAVTVTAEFVISSEERTAVGKEAAAQAGVDYDREVTFLKIKMPSTSDTEAYQVWLDECLLWDDFRNLRYQKIKTLRQDKIRAFLSELNIEEAYMDDGKYHIESLCLPEKLELTKEQIMAAAERDNVSRIDVYTPPVKKYINPQSYISKELYEKLGTMQDDERVWVDVHLNQFLGTVDHELMEQLSLEMYGVNLTNGYNDNYYYYYYFEARSRLNHDYNIYRYLVRYDNLDLSPEDMVEEGFNYHWDIFCAHLTKAKIIQLGQDVSVFLISLSDPQPVEDPTESDTLPIDPPFDDETVSGNRFENTFLRYLVKEYGYLYSTVACQRYEEVYYHHTDGGKTDWALIYACTEAYPGVCHAVFDDILIEASPSFEVFSDGMGFGIFDIGQQKFYSLDKAWEMDYPDLHDVFYQQMTENNTDKRYGYFSVIGDMDGDGKLTLIDVTCIQRCHAGMADWNDDLGAAYGPLDHSYLRYGFDIRYRSDYDRDGERDITDATMLQRRLAKLI